MIDGHMILDIFRLEIDYLKIELLFRDKVDATAKIRMQQKHGWSEIEPRTQ